MNILFSAVVLQLELKPYVIAIASMVPFVISGEKKDIFSFFLHGAADF